MHACRALSSKLLVLGWVLVVCWYVKLQLMQMFYLASHRGSSGRWCTAVARLRDSVYHCTTLASIVQLVGFSRAVTCEKKIIGAKRPKPHLLELYNIYVCF